MTLCALPCACPPVGTFRIQVIVFVWHAGLPSWAKASEGKRNPWPPKLYERGRLQSEFSFFFKLRYALCARRYAILQRGHDARMTVPFPSVDRMSKEPPENSIRSLMLVSPKP